MFNFSLPSFFSKSNNAPANSEELLDFQHESETNRKNPALLNEPAVEEADNKTTDKETGEERLSNLFALQGKELGPPVITLYNVRKEFTIKGRDETVVALKRVKKKEKILFYF
ncbi:hypothetical protein RFI_21439 [Reticulomyxa filosa]|uniref:Uncharacterized protein n=1 Tax=Reticulomyxa filosa TaxID=46433 RepID=X6MQ21_RETFI|nr:hypothetical protein RFI_21439 [Reticulomyxa filosa]|eukprot:ETO15924.1 hypothetical protein RFI_21439 [Reticulomyxa filosa]